VVYGMFRADGRPVMPPEASGYMQSLAGRLVGWFRNGSRNEQAVARVNHQIQLLVESEAPLTPRERDQMLAFFDLSRRLIQKTGLGVGEVGR
jgi:hypothetical protein